MNYLKLRKKVIRAYETFTGCSLKDAPTFLRSWTKQDLVSNFRVVKPAARLQYFRDFRFFIQNTKYEFEYVEREP